MTGQVSFYGMYLPGIMLLALAAWPLSWGVRRLLAAAGFYRWVWHPALFDTALYVLMLYALSRATASLQ